MEIESGVTYAWKYISQVEGPVYFNMLTSADANSMKFEVRLLKECPNCATYTAKQMLEKAESTSLQRLIAKSVSECWDLPIFSEPVE
jgi:hypothetical protein